MTAVREARRDKQLDRILSISDFNIMFSHSDRQYPEIVRWQ